MREQLRKAGMAIRNFDDAYAEKVRDLGEKVPGVGPLIQLTAGMPLTYKGQARTPQELAMDQAMSGKGPASKAAVQRHAIAEEAFGYGTLATSAAARYALPAGGVTLAGAGIIDLASRFGSGADYPEEQQLTLQ